MVWLITWPRLSLAALGGSLRMSLCHVYSQTRDAWCVTVTTVSDEGGGDMLSPAGELTTGGALAHGTFM